MRIRNFSLVVAGFVLYGGFTDCKAQGPQQLAGFHKGPSAPFAGSARAPLYLHSDGNFYTGMQGGDSNNGALVKFSPNGNIQWQSFTGTGGNQPGKNPDMTLLRRPDGWLWGTTTEGGWPFSMGSVFRLRPETKEFQMIVSFSNGQFTDFPGQTPVGQLVPDNAGWLWGATVAGGTGAGVIYRVNEVTGEFNAAIKLPTGVLNPTAPAALTFQSGFMWGTSSGGTNGGGTIFRFNPTDSPNFTRTTVGEFTGTTTVASKPRGTTPVGQLIPDTSGNLWGATHNGALGFGTVFKVDTTNSTTATVIEFGGTSAPLGANPRGSLVADGDGMFWGTTGLSATGNAGTVFKIDPSTGTLTTVVEFGAAPALATGLQNPQNALTYDGNGYMWGLALIGVDKWGFYKVRVSDGVLTKVGEYLINGAPDGSGPKYAPVGSSGDWLYGTTYGGGKYGCGTLYRINAGSGLRQTLVHFTGAKGNAVGNAPNGKLHFHTDGTIWGTTTLGGASSNGSVFKYDPSTGVFTHIASLSGTNAPNYGSQPLGSLATGLDGNIWGTTSNGSSGSVFKINPTTGEMTTVKIFGNGNDVGGSTPTGGLVADANGVLWGTTSRGGGIANSNGSIGAGTIFKINTVTNTITIVVRFTGSSGDVIGTTPTGDLAIDSNGKIWGMTTGRVFTLNPTTGTLIYNVTSGSATGYPRELALGGSLFLHNDGMYYGANESASLDENNDLAGGGSIFRLVAGRPTLSTSVFNPSGDPPYPGSPGISLGGSVSFDNNSGSVSVEWGQTTVFTRSSGAVVSGNTATATLLNLKGLTSYFYRLKADMGGSNFVYGPIQNVVTRANNDSIGIVVQGNIGSPVTANTSFVEVGRVPVGQTGQASITIQNVSGSAFTPTSAVIGGPDAAKFSVSTLDTSALAARASRGLVVTYTPGEAATHQATLTINSNAPNNTAFIVKLSGVGVNESNLVIEQSGIGLSKGGSEMVEFGAISFGNPAVTRTFTLRNTGNAILNNISAQVSGLGVNNFTIPTPPPSSLNAGESATFDISFSPNASGGNYDATLTVNSSDLDESSVKIGLHGVGTSAGALSVTQESAPITSNSTFTHYGTVAMYSTSPKTFTLTNDGPGTIYGISVAYTGGGSFGITRAPVATLSPQGSTSLDIAFMPTTVLPQQASYTITYYTSPDASAVASTFIVKVDGTGDNSTQSDINVTYPLNTFTIPVASGGTYGYGTPAAGATATQTFTITNTGAVNLTGIAASLAPGSSSDFKITKAPGASVSTTSGANTTVTVTFKPTVNGSISAHLLITSNDPNENPYDILLTGTGSGIPVPEIGVKDGATSLVSGTAQIAMGTVPFSTPGSKILTIENTGTGPLSGISASFGAGSSSGFKITKAPGASIAAGGTSPLTVTYTPTVNSQETATLLIASNDTDENPFSISFTATGSGAPEPNIVISENSTTLTNNVGVINFGSVATNLSVTKTFTLQNTGLINLSNIALNFTGGSSTSFAVVTPPPATVAKNASTTFVVRFTPNSAGIASAALRVSSNDPNENPFVINLTGTGQATTAPTFTAPPADQLMILGGMATFDPTVAGTGVTYQWKKNGANIKDATSRTLSFTPKAADAAAYTLTATNGSGTNTSQPAYLGLVTLSQGTQIIKEGGSLSLACTVAAPTAPGVILVYQWRCSGAPLVNAANHIAGADTKSLKVTNMVLTDSGNYTCYVTLKTPYGESSCANGDTMVSVVKKPTITPFMLADASVSETISAPKYQPVTADFAATFTATGLPPGVTLNKDTGVFSGKPTAPKIVSNAVVPYQVKVIASNPAGSSDPVLVDWKITALDSTLVGTFNGVVARHNLTNFGFGGLIQITTAPTGVVSGSVTLAGQKYPVAGVLDTSTTDPEAHLIVKRMPATLGNLNLDFTITKGGNVLSGEISDPQFPLYDSNLNLGDGTAGSDNGAGSSARFDGPRGILLTGHGGYIADTNNHTIRAVDDDGNVTVFTGNNGVPGTADGGLGAAEFHSPEGMAFDSQGNIFIADTGNHCIRKITMLPTPVVSTFAGSPGTPGSANGTGTAASFSAPCAIAVDATDTLVVVDRGNHMVRKITPAGVVTTLAGMAGTEGFKDGAGTAALFSAPGGVTYDGTLKAFFVADTGNAVIRKITPAGVVSTYAGSPGIVSGNDGLLVNSRFVSPNAITSDGYGTLFVADTDVLVQITPGGIVGMITGLLDPMNPVDRPAAVAFDPDDGGMLIVADAGLNGLVVHENTGASMGATFTASRTTWSATNVLPTEYVGAYTAGISSTLPDDDFPKGTGYATLAITAKTGAATWAGKTADGSALTCGTFLGPNGEVPFHVMLYKNTGSIQGTTVIDKTTGDLTDDLPLVFDWNKIPQPSASTDQTYKGGISPQPLALLGGKYTPANAIFSFLGLDNSLGNATADFSDGDLESPFGQLLDVTAPNTVKVQAANNTHNVKLLTFVGSSGLFTGSLTQGARSGTFAGVLVHNSTTANKGVGYFLLPQDTVLGQKPPILSGKVTIWKAH